MHPPSSWIARWIPLRCLRVCQEKRSVLSESYFRCGRFLAREKFRVAAKTPAICIALHKTVNTCGELTVCECFLYSRSHEGLIAKLYVMR